ncbi:MAG: hypothetical protein Tsb004_30510 [Allomuricauda sp.]
MTKKKYFILVFCAVIVLGLLWNYRLTIILKSDGIVTDGKILELVHRRVRDYSLKYEYHVNGILYEGSVGCSYFECDDGSRGCEGKEVRVIYSESDPSVSDVDLGPNNDKKGRRLYY